MHERYVTFSSHDNLQLFARIWQAQDETQAVVALIHGGFEHSGRYAHVAEGLSNAGLGVYACDLRGHGRSQGRRGYIREFEDVLLDMDRFLSLVEREEPQKPLFILAHSAGGLVALSYILSRRQSSVRGIVLSAPALMICNVESPLTTTAVHVLAWVLPRVRIPLIDARFLSHDQKVVAAYRRDPLIPKHGLAVSVLSELLHTMRTVSRKFSEITIPFYIIHGTDDRLADIRGSQALYAAARSEDKTLKLHEGLYHELLNEPQRNAILKDIIAWITARA